MEPIKVTGTFIYSSSADVMAQLTKEGGVDIWFDYERMRRQGFICTPEEWDRLVAWVEWQRKERIINKGES
jgi:hypothetical protein